MTGTVCSSLIAVTPVRVQANYLMWRAAASSMGYMTEAADKVSLCHIFGSKLSYGTVSLCYYKSNMLFNNIWLGLHNRGRRQGQPLSQTWYEASAEIMCK
jgi:hypothetical protein